MKKIVAVVLVLAAAIAFQSYRTGGLGWISSSGPDVSSIVTDSHRGKRAEGGRRIPAGGTVCVNPVSNGSGKNIDPTWLNKEIADQLQKTGFPVANPGDGALCAATVHTEILSLEGRSNPKVDVGFRVVLRDDQLPRLCLTVSGKPAKGAGLEMPFNPFTPANPDRAAAERSAIAAAFTGEARKIWAAQKDGMPVYEGLRESRE